MKFTIGDKIGDTGGFGSVHICTSESGDKYAIKFLDNLDDASTERFKKEIRLTTKLSHPNIVKIIGYNADGDRKYYIMPLYASSLKAVINYLYGNYDRQYKVISEILNGVIYLHSEGVLHRDLKPENILYNSDSDIVINDLGLGRQIDSDSTRLTRTGFGLGTLSYMAPEQFNDAKNVDERSDIYSLGRIIEDIVTNMSVNPIPNQELDHIIQKCVHRDSGRRYNTVAELKSVVDSIYQRLLGISESTTIAESLSHLKLGNFDFGKTQALALKLLDNNNSESLEEFFDCIPRLLYIELERVDQELTETLIIQLRQYYTGQSWGFSYTDIIGRNCEKLYGYSNNAVVKANLLYSLIEVSLSHNRFYVMDIAINILKAVSRDVVVCLELANLLNSIGKNIRLRNFRNLNIDDLPADLKPFYGNENTVDTSSIFDINHFDNDDSPF